MFDCKSIAYYQNYANQDLKSPLNLFEKGICIVVINKGNLQVLHSGILSGEFSASCCFVAPCPCSLIPADKNCHISYIQFTGLVCQEHLKDVHSPTKSSANALAYYKSKVKHAINIFDNQNVVHSSSICYRLICDLANEESFSATLLPALVENALNEISENFSHIYGIQELADILNVSKEHLVRVFKNHCHVTPGQYLTKTKINASKQLLAFTKYNLEEISNLCGFSGANYFCKVFKQQTGQTPNEYRISNNQASYQSADIDKLLDKNYL